jgi:YfiH family protein
MGAPAWIDADWPAPPGVRALSTLRCAEGVSPAPYGPFNLGLRSGDDPALVERNRELLSQWLALPSPPHWLQQVHGTRALRVHAPPAVGPEPEADAVVTAAPGVVLAILSADCLPVVLAATDGSEVAAAHAGWRGLADGVLEATVSAMATPAAGLRAWLGPAAGPTAYEVGIEVREAFLKRDAAAAGAFVATRPGHWYLDLYAVARQRLAAIGLQEVHGGGFCTIGDAHRFHSHRRDGRGGRMATLAWISPAGG